MKNIETRNALNDMAMEMVAGGDLPTIFDPGKALISDRKENMTMINEGEAEKVAGGVPILHPIRKYEDPPAEPEEPVEGGAQGTW